MSFFFDLFNHNQSSATPTNVNTTSNLTGGSLPQATTSTPQPTTISTPFNPFSVIDGFIKNAINDVSNIVNTIGQNIQNGINTVANDVLIWRHNHGLLPTPKFHIGDSKDASGIIFNSPQATPNNPSTQITAASINLTVDSVSEAAKKGLNYWALQTNFSNGTWAHGGLQTHLNTPSQPWDNQINWGGLASGYDNIDPAKDLDTIQNGPENQRIAHYNWQVGKEYTLSVQRGALITFPAGNYSVIGGSSAYIDHPRSLWEWTFTIKPTDGNGPVQVSTLYDSSPYITSLVAWSESGYGSENQPKSSIWTDPQYTTADGKLHYATDAYR